MVRRGRGLALTAPLDADWAGQILSLELSTVAARDTPMSEGG